MMALWTWNSETLGEERSFDILALIFHKDDLDETLRKRARPHNSRAHLWSSELNWGVRKEEYDQGPFASVEYSLVATSRDRLLDLPLRSPAPNLPNPSLGNTTLAARMGENPFIVACTRANCLYHTNALFDWRELNQDVRDKILRRAACRVVKVRHSERRFPNMPADRENPWPKTIQKFVFERPRQDILDMAGGPLTVTFNDRVDRSWFDFARLTEEGWSLDPDAVCAAMDFEQTWPGVAKIRLRRTPGYVLLYRFEFVRPGRRRSR
jgi:hypothetical protein